MMKTRTFTLLTMFILGIAVGVFAAKKVDTTLYMGKDKKEASKSLLELAKKQAGKGSWENIAVGRVYYLGGMKPEGQAIFDSVTSRKPEGGDWMRIGRVYYDAGEWDKAKEAFDKTLKMDPKDAPWLAEIGGYYNLKGDRTKAEELFTRSFSHESEIWNTVHMAGSYVGVPPR